MIAGACLPTAFAAVVWDESVRGDFSNDGLTPTVISVGLGSNQILGTTGRGTAIDRDYLSFTIPTGSALTAMTELSGTSVGGLVSFIGLQSGPAFTIPPTATDATGLLGWTHYGSTPGRDLLPDMSTPNMGSLGFSRPLGAGTYSFWIQDFNAGSFRYGFDLTIAPAASAVPEPAAFWLALPALAGLGVRRWRQVRR